jgi:hypothetical protein
VIGARICAGRAERLPSAIHSYIAMARQRVIEALG